MMKRLVAYTRASLGLLLLFTVLLGGVYPLLVTAIAQGLFPTAANGSLVKQGDKVVGSELLGQHFDDPKYFWGRLSATTPPYNPSASSGSNLNPANPKLQEAAQARLAALRKHPNDKKPVPVDLLTSSGSGLDPHISLAAAQHQVPRVANARRISPATLQAMVADMATADVFTGQSTVNVLKLNLALDSAKK